MTARTGGYQAMPKGRIGLAAIALFVSAPLHAQAAGEDVAPARPATTALPAVAASALADDESVGTSVGNYYAAHPGTLVWLRDADTRAAAAKLPEILRNDPLLADGSALAAKVDAALA